MKGRLEKMKGRLEKIEDKWFIRTFENKKSGELIPVHSDDYFLHLVQNEEVEYKLERMGFARVKSNISVTQASVNSLRLYMRYVRSVPEFALETINPRVLREAGVKQLVDKAGNLVTNHAGEVLYHIPK